MTHLIHSQGSTRAAKTSAYDVSLVQPIQEVSQTATVHGHILSNYFFPRDYADPKATDGIYGRETTNWRLKNSSL